MDWRVVILSGFDFGKKLLFAFSALMSLKPLD
jgi:hypothetical protein